MKRLLQAALLNLYRAANASGLFSTRWGASPFEHAYFGYKETLEAGDIRVLESLIAAGTIVIDVGANIGFFTRFFGRCVTDGGKVLAIEPEATNFSRLNQMLSRNRLAAVVETIQAVAADKGGSLKLKINPLHPGDHKISNDGIPINALTLDELLSARQWPRVSLIKADVQGAELMVLRGAEQTLRRFHPALYLEIDDEALRAMNTSADELFHWLRQHDYRVHRIIRGSISPTMELPGALALCCGGEYADFLFL